MAELENDTNFEEFDEDIDLDSIFGDEEEQDYLEDSTENAESAPGDDFEDDFEDDFGDFGDVEAPDVESSIETDYNSGYSVEEADHESADTDGVVIEGNSLLEEEDKEDENIVAVSRRDWISSTGEVVVMDTSSDEGFSLEYIDINNIAIAHRIRNSNNVEDLVKSIKSTGLLHPLVVAPTATKGIYVLLHGYRRILACARVGIRKIPCIINTKVNTSEIPVLEAMYNHNRSYTIKEMINYIDYLEKEKGILSASMIEYLLQMNSGDYTKLKDILNDDDDDIVSKLMDGTYTIDQAFKKLEQRRKKESAEEKAIKKAEKVYGDEKESGVEAVAGTGEQVDADVALSDSEIEDIMSSLSSLDDESESLEDAIEEGNNIEGYQPNVQDVHNRERIDPAIKDATLQRDGFKCRCCGFGAPGLKLIMDYHHVLPVFLGGSDTVDNGITLCLTCHNLVHQWSMGKLNLVDIKSMDEQTQERFKKIIRLGNIIREGMAKKKINIEQARKQSNLQNVGRRMPGTEQGADA